MQGSTWGGQDRRGRVNSSLQVIGEMLAPVKLPAPASWYSIHHPDRPTTVIAMLMLRLTQLRLCSYSRKVENASDRRGPLGLLSDDAE